MQFEKQAKNRTSGVGTLKTSTSTYAKWLFHQVWAFTMKEAYAMAHQSRWGRKVVCWKIARTVWKEGRLVAFLTPITNLSNALTLQRVCECSVQSQATIGGYLLWVWFNSREPAISLVILDVPIIKTIRSIYLTNWIINNECYGFSLCLIIGLQMKNWRRYRNLCINLVTIQNNIRISLFTHFFVGLQKNFQR